MNWHLMVWSFEKISSTVLKWLDYSNAFWVKFQNDDIDPEAISYQFFTSYATKYYIFIQYLYLYTVLIQ